MRCFRLIRIFIERVANRAVFKLKRVKTGTKLASFGLVTVRNQGRISIGDECILRSGAATNPLGGTRLVLAVGVNGCITIGNHVGISYSCLRIDTELVVEDYVNIGGDCKIYDSDMHSVEFAYRIQVPDTNVKKEPIHIKEGAWIGAHSIILKGVTVGARSVIGAGSVVTKDIPDDEVWAGNPAKFVKKINQ